MHIIMESCKIPKIFQRMGLESSKEKDTTTIGLWSNINNDDDINND